MKLNRRYKRLLATFIMLLYGFILVPVVFWHSHARHRTHVCIKASGSDDQHLSVSDSCFICEHAYAPFISQHDTWEHAIPFLYQHYNQCLLAFTFPGCTRCCNIRGSPLA